MAGRWETLPCGANSERLVEYAADGLRPPAGSHEAGCSYCQAAIGEFAELWRPVREWSTLEVSVPGRFVAAVMWRVRRIAQSPRHAISVSARGATVVTSWVLGLIAATATRDTPGVIYWWADGLTPTGGGPLRRRWSRHRRDRRSGHLGKDFHFCRPGGQPAGSGRRRPPQRDRGNRRPHRVTRRRCRHRHRRPRRATTVAGSAGLDAKIDGAGGAGSYRRS